MFFLGVAGSFLPYLIGVVVLFFLTIGINGSREIEFAEIDEKKIENFKLQSINSLAEENFYFFNKTDNPEIISQSIQSRFFCFEFFDYSSVLKIPIFNTPGCGEILRTFHSGLSPPELIS